MGVLCKPRAIAYFGLMHMVATNLCVWFNVIIEETKQEILHFFHEESASISAYKPTAFTHFSVFVFAIFTRTETFFKVR